MCLTACLCHMQLLYVALTSSFPFNSLLSGLAGSAGFAVLTREFPWCLAQTRHNVVQQHSQLEWPSHH